MGRAVLESITDRILGEKMAMEWTDAFMSLSPLKVLQSQSQFRRK